MNISRDQMTKHIHTGHAQPWTQPLGAMVPTAARIDHTWYVVLDDTDHYQPAPPALAAVLTQAHTLLAAADEQLALANTQHP